MVVRSWQAAIVLLSAHKLNSVRHKAIVKTAESL